MHWSGALSEERATRDVASGTPEDPAGISVPGSSLSALSEVGVRPGTAASGSAAPASLSALSGEDPWRELLALASGTTSEEPVPSSPLSASVATALSPQGRLLGLSGRAQLALVAAVTLGGPLMLALYWISEALA